MKATIQHFRWGFIFKALFWALLVLGFSLFEAVAVPGSRTARAELEILGYRSLSYGSVYAPTAAENQSKLWFNDGGWWGSLYNPTSDQYEIHSYDWASQTWNSTGTPIDRRKSTRADCLWDGQHLYVVSAVRPNSVITDKLIHILRFSYDQAARSYSLDTGFPVVLPNAATIGAVIDKDASGMLWITYTASNDLGESSVYVAHSTDDDTQWTEPYELPLPGATNLYAEDISSLVAFQDQVGVMWSNQNEHTMYFAVHTIGKPDTAWQSTPALQGDLLADNHINLKTLQTGDGTRVFAAVKTSLNDADAANLDAPLVLLLERMPDGSWSKRTFGRVSDKHTRPMLLIDQEYQILYMFATSFSSGAGVIYYKRVSLSKGLPQFSEGLGNPFLQLGEGSDMHHATSTKQSLDSSIPGMLVLAEDRGSGFYAHNYSGLQGMPPITDNPPGGEPVMKLLLPIVVN